MDGTVIDNTIIVEMHEGMQGELPPIRDLWVKCLKLAPQHQHLFTYDWFSAWMASITNDDASTDWSGRSRTFVAKSMNGKVVGVLVLAHRRQHGVNWWSTAGYYQPLRGFLCVPNLISEICAAFAEEIVQRQGPLDFIRLGPIESGNAECATLLRELSARNSNNFSISLGQNIAVESLPASVDEYDAWLRKATSNRLKKILVNDRRWTREPNGHIHHYHRPTGVNLVRAIDDCSAIEVESWLAEHGGHFRFTANADRTFWLLVGESAADNGLDIDIWIAYLGEIPIAFEFTLTTGAICYRLAGHYKQAYAKHGLGWVLSHHNLRHLIARGVRYVDHAPGDVEYKQVWGAKEEESSQRVDWFMLPNNLIGSLGKALTSIPVIRKRIESKMHGD